jgi:hypothetical protein
MASSAQMTRTSPKPIDEVHLILLAAGALLRIMEELRRHLVHIGTPLAPAAVLLAEAHIFEAADILRSVASQPRNESLLVGAVQPTATA